MEITDYASLLTVARQQPEPQRFLFVFCLKSLSDFKNAEKSASFKAGQGGELTPVMTLEKPVDELTDFAQLVADAKVQNRSWHIVLVAALGGQGGVMPSSDDAVEQLDKMLKAVESGGHLASYMAFDTDGVPIQFS